MAIKVKATQQGYYVSLRNEGDEFEIADENAFSDVWMKRIGKDDDGEEEPPVTPPKKK